MISRVGIARTIAIAADALQLGLFPFFFEGIASPLNIAVDLAVCATLTWLVGWHIAFLPSFLFEAVPFIDIAPTWTIAILIATRKKKETDQTVVEPEKPQHASETKAPPKSDVIDVEVTSTPPANPPQLPEHATTQPPRSENAPPPLTSVDAHRRGSAEWPRAVMWMGIVAIIAFSATFMFKSCVDAPSKLLSNASDSAREFAAAFIKGTVTTQFHEYCTEVRPSLALQVATLKQMEVFTRSDEAVLGSLPLPEIVVSVAAPVEFVYHLDLNQPWDFKLNGNVLTVRVPEPKSSSPSFDVSNMKWTVEKDSIIRNTTKVKEELKQSLMPLAASRGRANVKLIRETAREQVASFVQNWLKDRFKDGAKYQIKVEFEKERPAS